MEIQEAYKQKMAAQLQEWIAQINLLDAKAKSAEADMRVRGAKELIELRAKQHAASEKLKELGTASGEAWDQLKATTDKIWDDLKKGVAEAQAKFK